MSMLSLGENLVIRKPDPSLFVNYPSRFGISEYPLPLHIRAILGVREMVTDSRTWACSGGKKYSPQDDSDR